MNFLLDTNYSPEERRFLNEHDCAVLSTLKLSRTNFSEYERPRRVFRYGGTYIAEIMDEESKRLVWAILSKWKGVYHVSTCYDSLEAIAQGL